MIHVFLYINKEETKPCLNTQQSTVVCNRTIYDLLIFSQKFVLKLLRDWTRNCALTDDMV